MRVTVPESLAIKQERRPGARAIESGTKTEYILHQSLDVPSMYSFKKKKSQYKNKHKSMYSVHTSTYWYVTRKVVLLAKVRTFIMLSVCFLYSVRTD